MSEEIVGEKGSLDAKPGSKSWMVAVKNQLLYLLNSVNATESNIEPFLEMVEETKGYKKLVGPDGEYFKSFIDFYVAPRPYGLGSDERVMRRVSQAERGRIAARLADKRKVLPNHRPEKLSTSTAHLNKQTKRASQSGISQRQQTRLDYITRNHPDLLEDIQQDRTTIYAAYQKAKGIEKQVAIPLNPQKAASILKREFSWEQLSELVRLLMDRQN